MRKRVIFSGVGTALITPFCDGSIDFKALSILIEYQINAGINALVIAGTTGEASTLSEYERYSLYDFCIEKCRGRIPLILGTGTNDTKSAVKYTKYASEMGADAALVVTPYYNKGTKSGIISHYKTIAESSDLPIILYNVPSRTGINLNIDFVEELIKSDNIAAIKEASDSIDRLIELSIFSDELALYSGNDSQTYVALSLGGHGIISVASNIAPKQVLNITQNFTRGDAKAALEAQKALLPLCKALFCETNPAPIKYAMSRNGFCTDEIRLPLSMPSEISKRTIDTVINTFKLLN